MTRGWLVMSLLVCGCGQVSEERLTVYPVSGTVLVNGRPAAGAGVFFHPQPGKPRPPANPHGEVKGDGSFVLSTYETNDGAPAGDYTVCIIWEQQQVPVEQETGGPTVSLVPSQYTHPSTSPLQATVRANPTELPPIQLAHTPSRPGR